MLHNHFFVVAWPVLVGVWLQNRSCQGEPPDCPQPPRHNFPMIFKLFNEPWADTQCVCLLELVVAHQHERHVTTASFAGFDTASHSASVDLPDRHLDVQVPFCSIVCHLVAARAHLSCAHHCSSLQDAIHNLLHSNLVLILSICFDAHIFSAPPLFTLFQRFFGEEATHVFLNSDVCVCHRKCRLFHVHSRAHDDVLHWMTTVSKHTHSDSVHDCSVVTKTDTHERDGREFVVSCRHWWYWKRLTSPRRPGLNTILFWKNFSCLVVFSALQEQWFNRRLVASSCSSLHR